MIFLGKNRDRVSLLAAVLSAANSGASKTKIMVTANLSFKLLEKYLAMSLQLGYIENNGSIYKCTSHGKDFLARFKNFENKNASLQRTLDDLAEERAILDGLSKKNFMLNK